MATVSSIQPPNVFDWTNSKIIVVFIITIIVIISQMQYTNKYSVHNIGSSIHPTQCPMSFSTGPTNKLCRPNY